MANPGWYDNFAPIYDAGTLWDWFYRAPRECAIDSLELHQGSSVFDIFCGTGINFPLLMPAMGTGGRIFAIDGSSGMLEKAQRRADRLELMESQIGFLKTDLSSGTGVAALCTAVEQRRPSHLLFTLGLTCLPNWCEFTDAVIQASPQGARLSIMDVYSEKSTQGARFINWIGAADCRRPIWQPLERQCESFVWREFRPFKILDVSVIVASGTIPARV
ncbi:hypothetical protein ACPF7Z_09305 [Halomonas sp. GXIMD04776]|uniref:hypothetical protein n=1 Tax=Halomonas sp. GXIMD04776 TaxID=3415605 RepID=UPI003CC49C91